MLTALEEDLPMPQSSLCYSWRLFLEVARGSGAGRAGEPCRPSPCSCWKHGEKGRCCRFSPAIGAALVEQTLGQGLSLREAAPESPPRLG